jgi:hypothetical protein
MRNRSEMFNESGLPAKWLSCNFWILDESNFRVKIYHVANI